MGGDPLRAQIGSEGEGRKRNHSAQSSADVSAEQLSTLLKGTAGSQPQNTEDGRAARGPGAGRPKIQTSRPPLQIRRPSPSSPPPHVQVSEEWDTSEAGGGATAARAPGAFLAQQTPAGGKAGKWRQNQHKRKKDMLPCSSHSPWWLNANSRTPGNEVAGSLMACYHRRRSSGWGGRGGGAGNFVLEVQTTTTTVIRDVRATRRVPGTRRGRAFPPVRPDWPARARTGGDVLAGKGSRFAPHGPRESRAPLPGRLPGTCSRAPGAALAPAPHEPPLLAVRRVQRGLGPRVPSSRAGG